MLPPVFTGSNARRLENWGCAREASLHPRLYAVACFAGETTHACFAGLLHHPEERAPDKITIKQNIHAVDSRLQRGEV